MLLGFRITPGVFAPDDEPDLDVLPVLVPPHLVTDADLEILDTVFRESTRTLILKPRPWSEAAAAVADREVGRPAAGRSRMRC